MDATIWSRLPQELLEHILSFLPFRNYLNLRSTCKHFESLIFSPIFVSKITCSSNSPFASFLLLSHSQCHHLPLYDFKLSAWRNTTLPFSHTLTCSAASPSILLSTSKGLFCFSLPNSSCFLLCNILAKDHRIIEFPAHPFDFKLLTLVSMPEGYKIFMLAGRSSSNKAFVYCSKIQSWHEFDCPKPILYNNCHQGGVFFKGYLYFTTAEPFSVVCFDLESGKWETLEAELPDELTFVRLASDGEKKLYLIGGIGTNGISRSVKVWELTDDGNWDDVESLPELMCRKLMSVCYHNYEHVYCLWHQGMICVCSSSWPEILYYKVSRRTWHWLPKCPSLPEKWSWGFRWFSFVPDMCTFV